MTFYEFPVGLTSYVRYRQVRYICDNRDVEKDLRSLNKMSLWFGILSSFGISLVANFQETNIFSVHLIGAFLAFGLGAMYQYLSVSNLNIYIAKFIPNEFLDKNKL